MLIDPHDQVREQLRLRLEREPEFTVVAQYCDCDEALWAISKTHPQVIIIDPVHKNKACLEMLQEMVVRHPGLSLVVLTAVPDTALRMDLKKVGVHAVLSKGMDTQELLETLRQAVAAQLG